MLNNTCKLVAITLILLAQNNIASFGQHGAHRILVSDIPSLNHALETRQQCDTILVKNGTYDNFSLEIKASGSKEQPLVIMARTAGDVVFTGNTALVLHGNHIVLSGFYFQAGLPSNGMDGGAPVIDIKGDNNRVTNCAFHRCHNRASIASLYQEEGDRMPKFTRIDHCYFADNFGWRLYLDLGKRVPGDDLKYAMYYRVDHNYFSTPYKFGANTGSAMRIGLGPLGYGRCLIDNNLFERQNGEVELIENKSHENVYLNNTFRNCEAQMSFRQGHRTIFLHNILIGTDPDRRCGGLGMWMDKHLVAGNYFSFPFGSYVPFDSKMKPREDRLPPAVVRFQSGCRNFIENGEPVGHFVAQKITFCNNLFFNNPDFLIDFSHNYEGMFERYEEAHDYEVSGSFGHRFLNNQFFHADEIDTGISTDKGGLASSTSTFKNNQMAGYLSEKPGFEVAPVDFSISPVNVEFDDLDDFNDWITTLPGLDYTIDLSGLTNSSVAELVRTSESAVTVIFQKQPLSFEDVGPDWLEANPSEFAQNGIMTNELKREILDNIQNESKNSQQSNIILIYADVLGRRMLSAWGQQLFTTPNIDKQPL